MGAWVIVRMPGLGVGWCMGAWIACAQCSVAQRCACTRGCVDTCVHALHAARMQAHMLAFERLKEHGMLQLDDMMRLVAHAPALIVAHKPEHGHAAQCRVHNRGTTLRKTE